tara:strand:- start:498 stop:734 length:237 start_codon:yes stop_codon:yes gene_type:complete
MHKFFVILLLLITCNGCAFMVAKETAKVIDTVLEGEPNPTKKEKILLNKENKKNKLKERAREFYCSKVKDKEKCNNVQ